MQRRPIYLDYAATTPVDPRVRDAMIPWLTERFGNPASRTHAYGWEAEKAVEEARAHVAELVGCEPRELVWTSGATEADNLAIKGVAEFYRDRGRHLVTLQTEHKAVLDSVKALESRGFTATYLPVRENGLVDLDELERALRPDTLLVSVALVNSEIGVIQPIEEIGALCRERGILFHVDAAQATGKVAIDLQKLDVSLMSFSAHKTYGPKGIGALYVRRRPRVRLEAQMHGGGHERGFRSGTLPTHQIVGMGEAYRLARAEMSEELPRIRALRDRLLAALLELPGIHVNGDLERRVPHNLNVSVEGIEGDALLLSLGEELAVSAGSACTSASLEPSYVLRALGRTPELARSALRLTLGRFTTVEEIDTAIRLLRERILALRRR
nr:IscS subfamily cysteine desulfurase [Tepidiphilus margaritifer]